MIKKLIPGIIVLSVSISAVVGATMLKPMLEDTVRTLPLNVQMAIAAVGLLFFVAFVIVVFYRTRSAEQSTSDQKVVTARSKPQTQSVNTPPTSVPQTEVVNLPRKKARTVPERPVYAADRLPEDVNAVINYILEHRLPWHLEVVAEVGEFEDLIHRDTDQEMWLQLAGAMNSDVASTYECLSAMLDHPACQNAVAVAILHKLGVAYYFTEARGTPLDSTDGGRVILKIIERNVRVGFPCDGVGDAKWVDRAKLLKELTAVADPDVSGVAPLVSLVAQKLSGPKPRERYFMDESSVSKVLPPWEGDDIQDRVS